MKVLLPFLLTLALVCPIHAAEPAQVLLLGTFHFQDAGLDVVKQKDFNVMTPEAQAYLQELGERLAGFKPTKVLLEYLPENDENTNERYRAYRAGEFELPANEIYQLGFRIAGLAGLERVHGFDNQDVEWQAEAMFKYASEHDSPEMKLFHQTLDAYSAEEAKARTTLPLRDLLKRTNAPALDRMNMDLYLATNPIGAGEGFAGAVSSSSWWARNFRMYALVQQQAGPGERVLVIGGQGHVAILRQLLAIDRQREAVSIDDFL